MNVGLELRTARERAGLSLDQVSQNIKIQVPKLEALEANAYDRLPQGVYLEGIVRAYANEVGLDGNHLLAGLYAQPAFVPTRHIDATAAYDLDTFIAEDAPLGQAGVEQARQASRQMASSADTFPPEGRVAAPARRGAGRYALVVLALLAAFGLGGYLYQTSRPFPQAESSDVSEPDDAVQTRGATDTIAIPEAADERPDGVTANEVAGGSAKVPGSPEQADTAAAPAVSGATGSAWMSNPERLAERTSGTPGTSPEMAAETAAARPPRAAGDLSGPWAVTTQIDSSSLRTYEGLTLGYRLELNQQGNEITGSGHKISENGRPLGPKGRTPIAVRGTVDGNEATLTFTEQGLRRSTQGTFMLRRNGDGTWGGRFSSNAAQSSGQVAARRPPA